jgi:hypothetical protein
LLQTTVLISKSTTTGTEVRVTLRFLCAKAQGDDACIYLYNVLFNKIMYMLKFSQMNRNFYDPRGAIDIPRYK